MALGLPIAVTVGWQLATPATRSAAIDDTPGGAGGMGDAPARHTRPAPAPASSSVSTQLPSALPSVLPSAVRPALGIPTSAPATGVPTATSAPPTEASRDPLPPLTLPPVPTPTEPDSTPSATPSASATPTATATVEPRFRWSGH